jgi:hypothetical protein
MLNPLHLDNVIKVNPNIPNTIAIKIRKLPPPVIAFNQIEALASPDIMHKKIAPR